MSINVVTCLQRAGHGGLRKPGVGLGDRHRERPGRWHHVHGRAWLDAREPLAMLLGKLDRATQRMPAAFLSQADILSHPLDPPMVAVIRSQSETVSEALFGRSHTLHKVNSELG